MAACTPSRHGPRPPPLFPPPQGEEARLVLLSTVRSNGQGDIGFLKMRNRLVVMMSRAREGGWRPETLKAYGAWCTVRLKLPYPLA